MNVHNAWTINTSGFVDGNTERIIMGYLTIHSSVGRLGNLILSLRGRILRIIAAV